MLFLFSNEKGDMYRWLPIQLAGVTILSPGISWARSVTMLIEI